MKPMRVAGILCALAVLLPARQVFAGGSLEPRVALLFPVGASRVDSRGEPVPGMGALYGRFLFGFGLAGRWLQKPSPERSGIWALDYGVHHFYTESGIPRAYLTDQGVLRYKALLPRKEEYGTLDNPSLTIRMLPFHLHARYYWNPTGLVALYCGGGAQLLSLKEEVVGQSSGTGSATASPPYAVDRHPASTLLFGPQVHAGISLFPPQVVNLSVELSYGFHGDQSVYDPISFVARYKQNRYGGLALTFGASLYLPATSVRPAFGGEPGELVIDGFGLLRNETAFSFLVSCLASDYAVYVESVAVARVGEEGGKQPQGIICRAGQRYTLTWSVTEKVEPGTYLGTVTYLYGIAEGYDSYGKPIWQTPPRATTVTATTTVR